MLSVESGQCKVSGYGNFSFLFCLICISIVGASTHMPSTLKMFKISKSALWLVTSTYGKFLKNQQEITMLKKIPILNYILA